MNVLDIMKSPTAYASGFENTPVNEQRHAKRLCWEYNQSMSFLFTSMTGGVSLTTNYAGNASMGASRASGRLWLTAPVIYPNEPRKRRNTPNEF